MKRTISLITTVFFLFSNALALPVTELAGQRSLPSWGSGIPENLGTVSSAYDAGSTDAVAVILDLHCDPAVQRQIRNILEYVSQGNALKTVFTEGGAGRMDTRWIECVGDEAAREAFVNSLLEDGRLSGAEYFSIGRGHDIDLQGLEDRDMHRKNLARLRTIRENRDIDLILEGMEEELLLAERRSAGNAFEALFKNRSGRGRQYYRRLIKDAKSSRIDLSYYPDLTAYAELAAAAGEHGYRRAAGELRSVVKTLRETMPYGEFRDLSERTRSFSDLKALSDEQGLIERYCDISGKRTLERILKAGRKARNMDPAGASVEERLLSRDIGWRTGKNEQEREMAFLRDYFESYKDFWKGKISAAEFRYVTGNERVFEESWIRNIGNDGYRELDRYRPLVQDYYRVNEERTNLFFQNICKGIQAGGSKTVSAGNEAAARILKPGRPLRAVVMGGFHADSLARELRAAGISHVVLIPTIKNDTARAEHNYEKLLREQGINIALASSDDPVTQIRFAGCFLADRLLSQGMEPGAVSEAIKTAAVRLAGEGIRSDLPSHQDGRVTFTVYERGTRVEIVCTKPDGIWKAVSENIEFSEGKRKAGKDTKATAMGHNITMLLQEAFPGIDVVAEWSVRLAELFQRSLVPQDKLGAMQGIVDMIMEESQAYPGKYPGVPPLRDVKVSDNSDDLSLEFADPSGKQAATTAWAMALLVENDDGTSTLFVRKAWVLSLLNLSDEQRRGRINRLLSHEAREFETYYGKGEARAAFEKYLQRNIPEKPQALPDRYHKYPSPSKKNEVIKKEEDLAFIEAKNAARNVRKWEKDNRVYSNPAEATAIALRGPLVPFAVPGLGRRYYTSLSFNLIELLLAAFPGMKAVEMAAVWSVKLAELYENEDTLLKDDDAGRYSPALDPMREKAEEYYAREIGGLPVTSVSVRVNNDPRLTLEDKWSLGMMKVTDNGDGTVSVSIYIHESFARALNELSAEDRDFYITEFISHEMREHKSLIIKEGNDYHLIKQAKAGVLGIKDPAEIDALELNPDDFHTHVALKDSNQMRLYEFCQKAVSASPGAALEDKNIPGKIIISFSRNIAGLLQGMFPEPEFSSALTNMDAWGESFLLELFRRTAIDYTACKGHVKNPVDLIFKESESIPGFPRITSVKISAEPRLMTRYAWVMAMLEINEDGTSTLFIQKELLITLLPLDDEARVNLIRALLSYQLLQYQSFYGEGKEAFERYRARYQESWQTPLDKFHYYFTYHVNRKNRAERKRAEPDFPPARDNKEPKRNKPTLLAGLTINRLFRGQDHRVEEEPSHFNDDEVKGLLREVLSTLVKQLSEEDEMDAGPLEPSSAPSPSDALAASIAALLRNGNGKDKDKGLSIYDLFMPSVSKRLAAMDAEDLGRLNQDRIITSAFMEAVLSGKPERVDKLSDPDKLTTRQWIRKVLDQYQHTALPGAIRQFGCENLYREEDISSLWAKYSDIPEKYRTEFLKEKGIAGYEQLCGKMMEVKERNPKKAWDSIYFSVTGNKTRPLDLSKHTSEVSKSNESQEPDKKATSEKNAVRSKGPEIKGTPVSAPPMAETKAVRSRKRTPAALPGSDSSARHGRPNNASHETTDRKMNDNTQVSNGRSDKGEETSPTQTAVLHVPAIREQQLAGASENIGGTLPGHQEAMTSSIAALLKNGNGIDISIFSLLIPVVSKKLAAMDANDLQRLVKDGIVTRAFMEAVLSGRPERVEQLSDTDKSTTRQRIRNLSEQYQDSSLPGGIRQYGYENLYRKEDMNNIWAKYPDIPEKYRTQFLKEKGIAGYVRSCDQMMELEEQYPDALWGELYYSVMHEETYSGTLETTHGEKEDISRDGDSVSGEDLSSDLEVPANDAKTEEKTDGSKEPEVEGMPVKAPSRTKVTAVKKKRSGKRPPKALLSREELNARKKHIQALDEEYKDLLPAHVRHDILRYYSDSLRENLETAAESYREEIKEKERLLRYAVQHMREEKGIREKLALAGEKLSFSIKNNLNSLEVQLSGSLVSFMQEYISANYGIEEWSQCGSMVRKAVDTLVCHDIGTLSVMIVLGGLNENTGIALAGKSPSAWRDLNREDQERLASYIWEFVQSYKAQDDSDWETGLRTLLPFGLLQSLIKGQRVLTRAILMKYLRRNIEDYFPLTAEADRIGYEYAKRVPKNVIRVALTKNLPLSAQKRIKNAEKRERKKAELRISMIKATADVIRGKNLIMEQISAAQSGSPKGKGALNSLQKDQALLLKEILDRYADDGDKERWGKQAREAVDDLMHQTPGSLAMMLVIGGMDEEVIYAVARQSPEAVEMLSDDQKRNFARYFWKMVKSYDDGRYWFAGAKTLLRAQFIDTISRETGINPGRVAEIIHKQPLIYGEQLRADCEELQRQGEARVRLMQAIVEKLKASDNMIEILQEADMTVEGMDPAASHRTRTEYLKEELWGIVKKYADEHGLTWGEEQARAAVEQLAGQNLFSLAMMVVAGGFDEGVALEIARGDALSIRQLSDENKTKAAQYILTMVASYGGQDENTRYAGSRILLPLDTLADIGGALDFKPAEAVSVIKMYRPYYDVFRDISLLDEEIRDVIPFSGIMAAYYKASSWKQTREILETAARHEREENQARTDKFKEMLKALKAPKPGAAPSFDTLGVFSGEKRFIKTKMLGLIGEAVEQASRDLGPDEARKTAEDVTKYLGTLTLYELARLVTREPFEKDTDLALLLAGRDPSAIRRMSEEERRRLARRLIAWSQKSGKARINKPGRKPDKEAAAQERSRQLADLLREFRGLAPSSVIEMLGKAEQPRAVKARDIFAIGPEQPIPSKYLAACSAQQLAALVLLEGLDEQTAHIIARQDKELLDALPAERKQAIAGIVRRVLLSYADQDERTRFLGERLMVSLKYLEAYQRETGLPDSTVHRIITHHPNGFSEYVSLAMELSKEYGERLPATALMRVLEMNIENAREEIEKEVASRREEGREHGNMLLTLIEMLQAAPSGDLTQKLEIIEQRKEECPYGIRSRVLPADKKALIRAVAKVLLENGFEMSDPEREHIALNFAERLVRLNTGSLALSAQENGFGPIAAETIAQGSAEAVYGLDRRVKADFSEKAQDFFDSFKQDVPDSVRDAGTQHVLSPGTIAGIAQAYDMDVEIAARIIFKHGSNYVPYLKDARDLLRKYEKDLPPQVPLYYFNGTIENAEKLMLTRITSDKAGAVVMAVYNAARLVERLSAVDQMTDAAVDVSQTIWRAFIKSRRSTPKEFHGDALTIKEESARALSVHSIPWRQGVVNMRVNRAFIRDGDCHAFAVSRALVDDDGDIYVFETETNAEFFYGLREKSRAERKLLNKALARHEVFEYLTLVKKEGSMYPMFRAYLVSAGLDADSDDNYTTDLFHDFLDAGVPEGFTANEEEKSFLEEQRILHDYFSQRVAAVLEARAAAVNPALPAHDEILQRLKALSGMDLKFDGRGSDKISVLDRPLFEILRKMFSDNDFLRERGYADVLANQIARGSIAYIEVMYAAGTLTEEQRAKLIAIKKIIEEERIRKPSKPLLTHISKVVKHYFDPSMPEPAVSARAAGIADSLMTKIDAVGLENAGLAQRLALVIADYDNGDLSDRHKQILRKHLFTRQLAELLEERFYLRGAYQYMLFERDNYFYRTIFKALTTVSEGDVTAFKPEKRNPPPEQSRAREDSADETQISDEKVEGPSFIAPPGPVRGSKRTRTKPGSIPEKKPALGRVFPLFIDRVRESVYVVGIPADFEPGRPEQVRRQLFLSLIDEFFQDEESASCDPKSPLYKGFQEYLINNYSKFNEANVRYGKHVFLFMEYIRFLEKTKKRDPRKLTLAENDLLSRYACAADYARDAFRTRYHRFTAANGFWRRGWKKNGIGVFRKELQRLAFQGRANAEEIAKQFVGMSAWQIFKLYLAGIITPEECNVLLRRDPNLLDGIDCAGMGERLCNLRTALKNGISGNSGWLIPHAFEKYLHVPRQDVIAVKAVLDSAVQAGEIVSGIALPTSSFEGLASAVVPNTRKKLILLLPGDREAGTRYSGRVPGADVVHVEYRKPARFSSIIYFPCTLPGSERPCMGRLYLCREGEMPVFMIDMPASGEWQNDPGTRAAAIKAVVGILQYKRNDHVTGNHLRYIGLSPESWTEISLRGDTAASGLTPGTGEPERLAVPPHSPEAHVIEVCDPARMGPSGTLDDAPAYFDELAYAGVDTVLFKGLFPESESVILTDEKKADWKKVIAAAHERHIKVLFEYPRYENIPSENPRDWMEQGFDGIVLTGTHENEVTEEWLSSVRSGMPQAVFAFEPADKDREAAGQWASRGRYFIVRRVNGDVTINEKYTGNELVLFDGDGSAMDESARKTVLSRLMEQNAPYIAFSSGMRNGNPPEKWQYPAERMGDISRHVARFIKNRVMWMRYLASGEDIRINLDPLYDRHRESELRKIIKNGIDPLLSHQFLTAA